GNLKLLNNYMEKFLGMVKSGNDQIAPILSYGDLVQGTITIKRVYYVEGLNYNLFSVGQFCDADLEFAFQKSTCYIRDLKGNDILIGSRGTDLYSITLQNTSSPNPICLMAKATSSQAWLWHRRLSHLNFDTVNLLSKNDIVISLSKTSNDFVCVTCGKCVLNGNHDMCVLHYLNGVNSMTKMPMAMPISTREPKRTVNQSVAKPLRRTDASESTNQKSRHTTKKLYEHVTKICSWWYPKFTPPGYIWKPKSQIGNVNLNLVEIILFIVDSGCSKHMMGNLKLLNNYMEKFLGMVKSGNDQIAPILSYGDLVQGTITIKRVYYVEGLNYNLFSVGQFCDADLEFAFQKSTCYIRD
nr:retrovirus-related Pol polyprotein from transposon TNT 1-94 [Tanacetum cinerariifolium]